MSDEVILRVKDAAFAYGKKNVWENINLEVKRGECLSILGANGCGKTTLLNCISGTHTLKSGLIELDGKPVADYSVRERAKKIGYVFQEHKTPFPYSSIEIV